MLLSLTFFFITLALTWHLESRLFFKLFVKGFSQTYNVHTLSNKTTQMLCIHAGNIET